KTNMNTIKRLSAADPFDIVIAGISEMNGPVVYSFSNVVSDDGWPAFDFRWHARGVVFGSTMSPFMHAHILKNGGLRKEGLSGLEGMRNTGEAEVERVI